jgi:hypothetical protein
MNINLLFAALTKAEKDDLFHLLADERIPANSKDLTTVKKFVEKHKAVISGRLRNCLVRTLPLEEYVDFLDITLWRNVGKKTKEEFVRLRGF